MDRMRETSDTGAYLREKGGRTERFRKKKPKTVGYYG